MWIARIDTLSFLLGNVLLVLNSRVGRVASQENRPTQDQPWIWPDKTTHNQSENHDSERTTVSAPDDGRSHPCELSTPVMPEFRTPGRRISEAKCMEFIWQRKNREDESKRRSDCGAPTEEASVDSILYVPPIIGGTDALPEEYPHMGAIGWRAAAGTWLFKCGASLISSKFMLTAAHCSKATPLDINIVSVDPEIVRLGDKNIIDVRSNGFDPIDAKILRIIVHPNYAAPKKYFDIALIELVEEQHFSSNVQPACLWPYFDTSKLENSASVTGWGVIETATRETSPTLQVAVVDIIDSEQCNDLLLSACNRKWCGVQEHQICAGKLAGGVDSCQGDSGGPLQVIMDLPPSDEGSMHYLIGVTSFGVGCARANFPGVYTRVSSFVDWIEGIVWPEG